MREKNDSLPNTHAEKQKQTQPVNQKLLKPKLTPKPTPVWRVIVYQTQIPKHQDIDILLSKSYPNPNSHPNPHPYGYIVPKSEWDNQEPWLYLDEDDTYGEENSLGPETAPLLYAGLKEILQKLK